MRNLILLLTLLSIIACSRGENVRIRGIIKNGNGKIYLDQQGLGEIRKVDSSSISKSGSFSMQDKIEVPTFYNVHLGDQNIIPLLIHPGETAEISTKTETFSKDYELNGSEESLQLQRLNQKMAKTNASLDSLRKILESGQDVSDQNMEEIQLAYDKIIKSQRRFSIEFVLENRTSMASIYALYQKMNNNAFVLNTNRDIQLLKITSEALDTLYPQSEYVVSLKRDAENLESVLKNRNVQAILDKTPSSLPEINLPNPPGDSISLSSFRGNVILLSFWASWNEPSVLMNQNFLNLYNKYHAKGFEIYQVSFDSELEDWVKAIQYDELPWTNVSELSYPESKVALKYNVTELPAYFLIDRNGQITGKNYDMVALDMKISNLVDRKQ